MDNQLKIWQNGDARGAYVYTYWPHVSCLLSLLTSLSDNCTGKNNRSCLSSYITWRSTADNARDVRVIHIRYRQQCISLGVPLSRTMLMYYVLSTSGWGGFGLVILIESGPSVIGLWSQMGAVAIQLVSLFWFYKIIRAGYYKVKNSGGAKEGASSKPRGKGRGVQKADWLWRDMGIIEQAWRVRDVKLGIFKR